MRRHVQVKWQFVPILVFLLVVMTRIEVMDACVRINNEDLIEYNCEGGSLEDLNEVPDTVEKIRISNISVGRLDETLLSRFGNSLLVFTCSHCFIKEISSRAFTKLSNLQQLSLDNNQLQKVHASWFEPGLIYLTYLDLNYNQIESLDPSLFGLVPSLVDLRLSGNRLECLDFQALSLLHDLKRIFLNENSNFGCPNALGMYLQSRGIDYEPDPQWIKQSHDRLLISKLLPAVEPSSAMSTTTMHSPSATTLPTTLGHFYTTKLPQPPLSKQEIDLNQGHYYEPTITSHWPNNYLDPQNRSSPTIGITSSSITVTTETTTIECFNSTALNKSINYIVYIMSLGLLRCSNFLLVQRLT